MPRDKYQEFLDLMESRFQEEIKNKKDGIPDFPFPMGHEEGQAYMRGSLDTLQWVLEMVPRKEDL